MSYVDAGYAIGLSTLFVYSIGLMARHRRLVRAVAAATPPTPAATPPISAVPTGTHAPPASTVPADTAGEPPRGVGE